MKVIKMLKRNRKNEIYSHEMHQLLLKGRRITFYVGAGTGADAALVL
jgi:hypothetical protein